ncbi:MAG: HPP family protein [Xanthomonadales bacterium]|nr:HPP family protein [Xanthomonadales bacterium]
MARYSPMDLLMDPVARGRLQTRWKAYLFAAVLSGLTLSVTYLLLGQANQVVIASLGATAFVVFAMPKSRAARTASTIGGQMLGLLCGGLAGLVPHESQLAAALVYGLAVGICSLLMLTTRYKHPPAAGTALGIAVTGIDVAAAITVIGSVFLISTLRIVTLSLLQDFSADE